MQLKTHPRTSVGVTALVLGFAATAEMAMAEGCIPAQTNKIAFMLKQQAAQVPNRCPDRMVCQMLFKFSL